MGAVHLTGSEWNVLSCLWERSPQTVMELVAELREQVGVGQEQPPSPPCAGWRRRGWSAVRSLA